MHVNGALLQSFPDFFRREKSAGEIRGGIKQDLVRNGRKGRKGRSGRTETGQPEEAAKNRGGQLPFPSSADGRPRE